MTRQFLRPNPPRVSLGNRRRLRRQSRLTGLACPRDGFFAKQAAPPTAPAVRQSAGARQPQFAAKAKSVIFLFMYGGPSHVDTFDYKPKLYHLDGKTIDVKTFGRGGHKNQGRVVGPKWQFKQYGQCGKWVSDLFPQPGAPASTTSPSSTRCTPSRRFTARPC